MTTAVKSVHQQGQPPIGPDFYVEALNLGPLPNRVGLVFARPSWAERKFRSKTSAFIMHDAAHIANTANAQRVEVGDSVTFVFPINPEFGLNEFS